MYPYLIYYFKVGLRANHRLYLIMGVRKNIMSPKR